MNNKFSFLRKVPGDGLAILAGAIVPFAFAPFKLALLAPLALVLLMLCWYQVSPGRAFLRGWLFGLSMFGIGVSWVSISMIRFGGMDMALSYFLTSLFVAFLALFPALTGYLGRKLALRGKHKAAREYLLIIPAMWMLVEWFRGFIFTGFPWLSLGYSQIDMPISGFAPLFGVYFVSFATVMTAGLITYMLLLGKESLVRAVPALVILWLVPGLLKHMDWSTPVGKPIKISMIQGNIPQDKKWLPEQRQATLDLYLRLSREHWDSNLVIWPETAVPALYHQVLPWLRNVAQEARMNSSELLVGIPIHDKRKNKYFNAMVSLGLQEKFYEKQHLVPFGEFIPLKKYLGGILDFFHIPMSDFSAGDDKPVLLVGGQYAGISICYEDVFGDEVAKALPDAKYLINASNDAWFGDSIAPHQHLQIARMRTLETGRYMAISTNNGISAFINNKGKIIAEAPQFKTDVLTDTIQPMEGMTLYSIFANIPVVLMAILMLGIAAFLGRKSGESAE